MKSSAKEHGDKVDSTLNITIGNLVLDGQNLGPHYLELAASDLSEHVLIALRQQLVLMQQQGFSLLQFAKYNQLLLHLANQGFNLEIKKLDIATPAGRASVTGLFNFAPTTQQTINLKEIAKNLTASISLKVPQALFNENMIKFYQWSDTNKPNVTSEPATPPIPAAQRAQFTLDLWLKNKWLLLDGDYYVTQVTYKDQTTSINGQKLMKEVAATPAQAAGQPAANAPPAAAPVTTTITIQPKSGAAPMPAAPSAPQQTQGPAPTTEKKP